MKREKIMRNINGNPVVCTVWICAEIIKVGLDEFVLIIFERKDGTLGGSSLTTESQLTKEMALVGNCDTKADEFRQAIIAQQTAVSVEEETEEPELEAGKEVVPE